MRRQEGHHTMPRARDTDTRASWMAVCQVCAAALLWMGLVSLLAGCLAQPTPPPSPVAERPTPGETPRATADLGCLALQINPETIWLVRGDGLPQPVTQGSEPLLSPDGRFLAFLRSFPTEVWVRALDGSGEDMLYVAKPVVYSMKWSPDGQVLAITNGALAKFLPTGDLWRVDVPQGTVTELASEKAGYPVFSPDGHWIALYVPQGWTKGSVAIIRTDGEEHRLLFDGVVTHSLEWARDSSGFTVIFTQGEEWNARGKEIWWVPTDGLPARLGDLPDTSAVEWQPGAEQLLSLAPGEDDRQPVFLSSRDGTERIVVPGSEGMILHGGLYGRGLSAWSPDGRWFLMADREGNFHLLEVETTRVVGLPDTEIVYGWLGPAYYLAGYGDESLVDLYRCKVLGGCDPLGHVPGWVQSLSYVRACEE